MIGRQPFAADAPRVLIYAADRTRMPEAAEDQLYAHIDSRPGSTSESAWSCHVERIGRET
jgi:hypothetical protein